MTNLLDVWQQIEGYLSDNISIIPVREKEEIINGKLFAAKTPFGAWKQYQSRITEKQELWDNLEKYNTSAVAMIGGKISGNLEIIDIDVKYFPGIDAILFADIAKFYPDLFARLRLHRTPSGGFHLLYRVSEGIIPGNLKLAGRPATEDELKAKPGTKIYNFLETRGEGGYALLPPSMGYTVHQNVPIPIITWNERTALISLCQSYTQLIKVERIAPVKSGNENYYAENPFEHFNNSPEGETVLESQGWKFFNENAIYKYFTRPDRDAAGISASFNKSLRIYYIWTTSAAIDSQKWLSPATLLAEMQFAKDKKKLHAYLVSKGYGKLSAKAEQSLLKEKAITGKPLPPNASIEAKNELNAIREKQNEIYPYGIFWQKNELGVIIISRERLYNVSEGLGFRLYNDSPVRITGYQIEKLLPRHYFDALKQYIREEDADIYEEIANSYEAFIQRSGDFTISRLPLLDTSVILKPTKSISYKFYTNCYISICEKEVKILEYKDIPGMIWADSIQPRNFSFCTKDQRERSLYYQFLDKAIGISAILYQSIGYYAHEYKDEEGGYFVVLSEQCESPKDGGGSGKNIFSSLFRHTTTFKNIPGTQVQFNEKFLQAWDGEKVFSMSDVPKNFAFIFLKELTTGSGIVKKLWQNERALEHDEMPKLIISTNYSYEISDGGLKRRIIPIEFTNFFTVHGGVNAYFNAMFPADWSALDWSGYDNIIALSIQAYFANKSRLQASPLTATGWAKQFDQAYPITRQFILQHINDWKQLGFVKLESFNQRYKEFCNENNINIKYQLSSQRMNAALADYCQHFNITFNKDVVCKENSINYRGKNFGVITENQTDLPF